MAATAEMSTSVRVGFDGVSTQISLVAGWISDVMLVSIDGVKVTETLWAEATLVKYLCVPP